MSHAFPIDQVSRDVLNARQALNEGLTSLRDSIRTVDDSIMNTLRGDGTKRTRNRPHVNEVPGRNQAPGGNARPVGGRIVAPGRPTMPGQRPAGTGALDVPAPPPADTSVVVPAQSTTGPPAEQPRPARPDRGDPAAEVWALVERAQAGESEAFGLIYDRYVDTVFRFVYFRVGNRQLAEDLTSDTFLRALKRIGSFTWQGRDLGAWLVTIARNLVADHFKSGRYRLEVTTGDVLDADREDRGP